MNFASLRESIACMNAMTYLNAGWVGPSPSRVIERMREAATRESEAGPAGPDGQRVRRRDKRRRRRTRQRSCSTWPPLTCCSRTERRKASCIVLHGLAWKPGDVLLTTDLEHPGIKGPAGVLEERGVEVRRRRDSAGCVR